MAKKFSIPTPKSVDELFGLDDIKVNEHTNEISVNEIIENPKNRFNMRHDTEYEELLLGIKKDGITNPIITLPKNSDGKYMILSGHRRFSAAKELGLDKVKVNIIDSITNEADEVAYMFRCNGGARQKYPYDIAAQIKEFYNALEKSDSLENKAEKTIEALGISQRAFYNYDALAKLPDEIIEWGRNQFLTRDQGIYLAKLLPSNQEKFNNIIEKIRLEFNDCADDEKSNVVQQIINGYVKNDKRNSTIIKQKALPKATSSMKKIKKVVDETFLAEFEMPKTDKQKTETLNMIDETLKVLIELKEKLN